MLDLRNNPRLRALPPGIAALAGLDGALDRRFQLATLEKMRAGMSPAAREILASRLEAMVGLAPIKAHLLALLDTLEARAAQHRTSARLELHGKR